MSEARPSVAIMTTTPSDLDAAAVLRASSEALVRRRLDQVAEMELLAQWAAIHSDDAAGDMVQVGGEGTPLVREHCLGEIALAREAGDVATRNTLADVLDLQHRLPRCWVMVRAGKVEPWVACKVARLSRALGADAVPVVDAAVARMLGHESPGRILDVAAAKVIEADVAAYEARVEAERRRRYLAIGRTDEHGLRTLIARIEAADAVWIDATVSRVAEIIKPQHEHADADELRAIALGYLARPAELLALLAEEVTPADDLPTDSTVDSAPEEPNRAIAFPERLLDRLRGVDWTKLAPKAVLYLHLHEAVLTGRAGVVRGEDAIGPRTLGQLHGLLRGAKVTIKPVIDLHDAVAYTAYEHPVSLKERVHLRSGGDYWPWARSTSRHVDYDHVVPFTDAPPGDPPPQTGTHNSGPLGRTHHRWKTFAGYRTWQIGPASYLWRTPHGWVFLSDHRGTYRLL